MDTEAELQVFLMNASFAGAAGRGKRPNSFPSRNASCVPCIKYSRRGAALRIMPLRRCVVTRPHTDRSPADIRAQPDRWYSVAQEIASCKECIRQIVADSNALGEEGIQRAYSFLSILSVFGVEVACRLKTWKSIPEIIEVTA